MIKGLGREAAVLAAVEEERLAIVALHAFDFAEEDGVIAGEVLGDHVASQFCKCAFQERNTGGSPAIANAEAGVGFGRLFAFGEMFGEGLLVFAEDADAEAALRFEEREQPGVVRDANENQKRIEGD